MGCVYKQKKEKKKGYRLKHSATVRPSQMANSNLNLKIYAKPITINKENEIYLAVNDVGDSYGACASESMGSALGGNVKFNLFFVILILLIFNKKKKLRTIYLELS